MTSPPNDLVNQPTHSAPYKYKSLTSARHIRLLILHPSCRRRSHVSCDLVPISLDNSPPFEAISYVWGDPEPKMKIGCCGSIAEIGPNLHRALVRLRYKFVRRVLWADALCINQKDNDEKQAQVKLMAEIYSKATKTLIWLGEESAETRNSLRSLRKVRAVLPNENIAHWRACAPSKFEGRVIKWQLQLLQLALSNYTKEFTDVAPLLGLPWFGRKWIIQELLKSRRAVVVLGRKQVPWSFVEDTVTWLGSFNLFDVFTQHYPRKAVATNFQNISTMHTCFTETLTIDKLLILSVGFNCSDPRDHVISLLNLASDGLEASRTLADYHLDAKAIYRRLALYLVFEKNSLLFFALHNFANPTAFEPSWVPDLSLLLPDNRDASASLSCIVPLIDPTPLIASGFTTVSASLSHDGNTLLLRGKLVTTIAQLGSTIHPTLDIVLSERQRVNDETQHQTYVRLLAEHFRDCESVAFTEASDVDIQIMMKFLRVLCWDYGETLSYSELQELGIFIHKIINRESVSFTVNSAFATRVVSRLPLPSGRHFCRTSNGRIGWAPYYAREGDIVVIFNGSPVPHVIRLKCNGRHSLVGDCYIDGLLRGEFQMCGVQTEEFALE